MAMARAAASALPLLDRCDELALAHPRGPGQAERLGEPLKLGQQHPGKTLASLLAPAGRGCRTVTVVRVRPGAYRAGLRWGSPRRRRHAGTIASGAGQTRRILRLASRAGEQIDGFAH